MPTLDELPFNFAEWFTCNGPWGAEGDGHKGATHDAWSTMRKSGTMTVTLVAQTAIFVPEGSTAKATDRSPRNFWHCKNAEGEDRRAIPGSTMKGVVRAHFEAWTNGRLGVVSEVDYKMPIPYRRVSADAWVVVKVNGDGSRDLLRTDIAYTRRSRNGKDWETRTRRGWEVMGALSSPEPIEPIANGRLDVSQVDQWQIVPARANLLWTKSHVHKYTHLAFRIKSNERAVIPGKLFESYRANLAHPSYRAHVEFVKDLPKAGRQKGPADWYCDIEKENVDKLLRDLESLEKGEIVFALVDASFTPRRVLSFGKNTYFLWPSRRKPEDLTYPFWPREEAKSNLDTADMAEAAFGFIGTHGTTTHPFRGRVRFGTFWQTDRTQILQPIQLGPLTSPTGTKLKARTVYLPPHPSTGLHLSYDEASLPGTTAPLTLRGRKFYWHQPTDTSGVLPPHKGASDPKATGFSQQPPPLAPLPAEATFEGTIQFENLTDVELGALIVSIRPGEYFGEDDSKRFGIKIGKAKPRGWGSVHAAGLQLRTLNPEAYKGLGEEPLLEDKGDQKRGAVAAFKSWLERQARAAGLKSAADLPFVQDLEKLLRIDGSSSREYPADLKLYSRPPSFGDLEGNPTGLRPRAMKKARDV